MSSIISNKLDEVPPNSYLSVAIDGTHGQECVYVAAKMDGEMLGGPDRAPSLLANIWEKVELVLGK